MPQHPAQSRSRTAPLGCGSQNSFCIYKNRDSVTMVLWCTRKPLHCKQQAVSFENSRVSCPAGTFADDHPEIVLTKGQSVRDTKSVFSSGSSGRRYNRMKSPCRSASRPTCRATRSEHSTHETPKPKSGHASQAVNLFKKFRERSAPNKGIKKVATAISFRTGTGRGTGMCWLGAPSRTNSYTLSKTANIGLCSKQNHWATPRARLSAFGDATGSCNKLKKVANSAKSLQECGSTEGGSADKSQPRATMCDSAFTSLEAFLGIPASSMTTSSCVRRCFATLEQRWTKMVSSVATPQSSLWSAGRGCSMHMKACAGTPLRKRQLTVHSWAIADDQLKPIRQTVLAGNKGVSSPTSPWSPSTTKALMSSTPLLLCATNSASVTGGWPNHSCRRSGAWIISKHVLTSRFEKNKRSPGLAWMSTKQAGFARNLGFGGFAAAAEIVEPFHTSRWRPGTLLGTAKTSATACTLVLKRTFPQSSCRTTNLTYSTRSAPRGPALLTVESRSCKKSSSGFENTWRKSGPIKLSGSHVPACKGTSTASACSFNPRASSTSSYLQKALFQSKLLGHSPSKRSKKEEHRVATWAITCAWAIAARKFNPQTAQFNSKRLAVTNLLGQKMCSGHSSTKGKGRISRFLPAWLFSQSRHIWKNIENGNAVSPRIVCTISFSLTGKLAKESSLSTVRDPCAPAARHHFRWRVWFPVRLPSTRRTKSNLRRLHRFRRALAGEQCLRSGEDFIASAKTPIPGGAENFSKGKTKNTPITANASSQGSTWLHPTPRLWRAISNHDKTLQRNSWCPPASGLCKPERGAFTIRPVGDNNSCSMSSNVIIIHKWNLPLLVIECQNQPKS